MRLFNVKLAMIFSEKHFLVLFTSISKGIFRLQIKGLFLGNVEKKTSIKMTKCINSPIQFNYLLNFKNCIG